MFDRNQFFNPRRRTRWNRWCVVWTPCRSKIIVHSSGSFGTGSNRWGLRACAECGNSRAIFVTSRDRIIHKVVRPLFFLPVFTSLPREKKYFVRFFFTIQPKSRSIPATLRPDEPREIFYLFIFIVILLYSSRRQRYTYTYIYIYIYVYTYTRRFLCRRFIYDRVKDLPSVSAAPVVAPTACYYFLPSPQTYTNTRVRPSDRPKSFFLCSPGTHRKTAPNNARNESISFGSAPNSVARVVNPANDEKARARFTGVILSFVPY